MSSAEANKRHAALAEELRRHDHAYYVLAEPTISDTDYDRLYRELLDLEDNHPELATADSPSQRVGGKPRKGKGGGRGGGRGWRGRGRGGGGGGAFNGGDFGGGDEPDEASVYVGNLSFDVTWRELKDFAAEAGEVALAVELRARAPAHAGDGGRRGGVRGRKGRGRGASRRGRGGRGAAGGRGPRPGRGARGRAMPDTAWWSSGRR